MPASPAPARSSRSPRRPAASPSRLPRSSSRRSTGPPSSTTRSSRLPTEILTELPSEFVVPIQLDDGDETYQWDLFVDYNPCDLSLGCQPSGPAIFPQTVAPTPGTIDGGISIVDVQLPSTIDATSCHRIDFLVAHQFNGSLPHIWDSIGGDIVTWFYNAGGGTNGCPDYDAGAFQDGAFPPADAGSDTLPVTPESGTGDP